MMSETLDSVAIDVDHKRLAESNGRYLWMSLG
jgi:hypothetical protein